MISTVYSSFIGCIARVMAVKSTLAFDFDNLKYWCVGGLISNDWQFGDGQTILWSNDDYLELP